jgi:hypothetical protein
MDSASGDGEGSMTSWPTVGFLAAVAGCGLIDAAAWSILAAAWRLTSMRIEAMSPVVARYAAVIGPVSAWSLFSGLALAGNAIACTVAFLAGRGLAIVTGLPV